MADKTGILFEEGYVEDFTKWKAVFDSYKIVRETYGFLNERVFQATNDPNHITLVFDIKSKAEAMKWMLSDKLQEAFKEGGVIGQPKYVFSE